jgi:hypothetical protein
MALEARNVRSSSAAEMSFSSLSWSKNAPAAVSLLKGSL